MVRKIMWLKQLDPAMQNTAGSQISVVFINCNPPPKSPNQMLRPSLKSLFLLMFENNDTLMKENSDLKKMNNKLWFEKSQSDTINLQNMQTILKKENAELKKLKQSNAKQYEIINSQNEEIESLKKQINDLKMQFSNSKYNFKKGYKNDDDN